TERELSLLIGKTPVTLRKWRQQGFGPRFVKVGGGVRYRKAAVESFLAGREYNSTGEAKEARNNG
ncbi:MAG: helix-turn-helix transcriptional regulator, partial [Victivallaceae bacterium]